MKSALYRFIKWLVRLFYPKIEVVGAEKLPKGGAVIVMNHAQMNGPIAVELYFPGTHYTWCTEEMMDRRLVPDYSFRDFWSEKPGYIRWFFRLLSYAIGPLAELIFTSANCIPVYRDLRVTETLRETRDRLAEGAYVVIFPESPTKRNNIVYEFQEGFVDAARLYRRSTGRDLAFVPVYLCPAFKKMYVGEPTYFDGSANFREERERVRLYTMDEITRIGRSLPEHRVVPYRNIPKKDYPKNNDEI